MNILAPISAHLYQRGISVYDAVYPTLLLFNRSVSSGYLVIINLPRVLQIEAVALTALQWYGAFCESALAGFSVYLFLRLVKIDQKISGALGITAAAVTCAAKCLHYIGKNEARFRDQKQGLIDIVSFSLTTDLNETLLSNVGFYRLYGESAQDSIRREWGKLKDFLSGSVSHGGEFTKRALKVAAYQAFTRVMVEGIVSESFDERIGDQAYEAGIIAAIAGAEFVIGIKRAHNLTETQNAIKAFRVFIEKNEAQIHFGEVVRIASKEMVEALKVARQAYQVAFVAISSQVVASARSTGQSDPEAVGKEAATKALADADRAICEGARVIKETSDSIKSILASIYFQCLDAGQDRSQARAAIATELSKFQPDLEALGTQVAVLLKKAYQTINPPGVSNA